jgi:hypothetical protein
MRVAAGKKLVQDELRKLCFKHSEKTKNDLQHRHEDRPSGPIELPEATSELEVFEAEAVVADGAAVDAAPAAAAAAAAAGAAAEIQSL